MVKAPQRTAFSSQTLIRLLARLTDAPIPESTQPLSERLSQWLGWTDAIAMSTALNANPASVSGVQPSLDSDEAECARVRAALAKTIAGESVLATSPNRGTSARAPRRENSIEVAEAPDYTVFRHRYLSIQQAMETSIGNLRERLRRSLAATRPAAARLAAVDAVMERALSAREHNLLATVPDLLGAHFQRLCPAEQEALPEGDRPAAPHGAWLDVFRNDMRSVLLAEMHLRFQPIEGLLAALRTS